MAADTDLVRHGLDGLGEDQQDVFEVGLQARTAKIEHRPVLGIHDLDAQAVLGDLEENLILELLQLGIFLDLGLQLLQQHLQTLLLDLLSQLFSLLDLQLLGRVLRIHGRLRRIRCIFHFRIERAIRRWRRRTTEVDNVRTGAFGEADGILEVARNRLFLLRCGRAHQPHHQEERHHRRGKVGKGNLPGATMVATGDLLDPLDDNWLVVFHGP